METFQEFIHYRNNNKRKELEDFANNVALKPRTPNTVTKIEDLERQLKQIRRDGIAFKEDEQVWLVNTPAILGI